MPLRDQLCIRCSRETQPCLDVKRYLVEVLAVGSHIRRRVLHLRMCRLGGYGNKHGQRLGGEVLEEGELRKGVWLERVVKVRARTHLEYGYNGVYACDMSRGVVGKEIKCGRTRYEGVHVGIEEGLIIGERTCSGGR